MTIHCAVGDLTFPAEHLYLRSLEVTESTAIVATNSLSNFGPHVNLNLE